MKRSEAFREAQRATGMRVVLGPDDDGPELELWYLDGDVLRRAGKVKNPREGVIFMDAWASARADKNPSEKPPGA